MGNALSSADAESRRQRSSLRDANDCIAGNRSEGGEYAEESRRCPSMSRISMLWTTGLPLFLGTTTLFYGGYGHTWCRSHAGDILVVAFLVGLLGVVTQASLRMRLLSVALVSIGLELGQLSASSGEREGALALVLGTHFDLLDFLYYALGLGLAVALHRLQSATICS